MKNTSALDVLPDISAPAWINAKVREGKPPKHLKPL